MRITVGCDIVFLPRFKKSISRTPGIKDRIFSPREQEEKEIKRLAGFFAAKEAAMKALGIPAGNWRKIEISRDESGKPRLEAEGVSACYDLSISHDGEYILAVVVFYNF